MNPGVAYQFWIPEKKKSEVEEAQVKLAQHVREHRNSYHGSLQHGTSVTEGSTNIHSDRYDSYVSRPHGSPIGEGSIHTRSDRFGSLHGVSGARVKVSDAGSVLQIGNAQNHKPQKDDLPKENSHGTGIKINVIPGQRYPETNIEKDAGSKFPGESQSGTKKREYTTPKRGKRKRKEKSKKHPNVSKIIGGWSKNNTINEIHSKLKIII